VNQGIQQSGEPGDPTKHGGVCFAVEPGHRADAGVLATDVAIFAVAF